MNAKFDCLTIVEDGIILKNERKEEREISFSELNTIFIKEYRLKEVSKLAIFLFIFLLTFLFIDYITNEEVILLWLIIIIPIFVKVNTYKSFRLIVYINDGTVFKKKVPLNAKAENIFIKRAVRRGQLNYLKKICT